MRYRHAMLLALLISLLLSSGVRAQLSPYAATLTWLRQYQQPDGGFTNGLTAGSDLLVTAEVIRAIVAVGQDPTGWTTEGGATPLTYLRDRLSAGEGHEVTLLVHLIPALIAAGEDPRSFADRDLIAELLAQQQALTYQMGASLLDHALAVQALQSAQEPVPPEALILLLSRQASNGGWGASGASTPETTDVHTTAQALLALVRAGETDCVPAALAYLHQAQNPDGGFPWRPGAGKLEGETETHATAFVLMALASLASPLSEWQTAQGDPIAALRGLYQAPAFYWRASVPTPNILATAYALQALTAWHEVEALSGFGGAGAVLPRTGLDGQALRGPGLVLLIFGLSLYRVTRRKV